MLRPDYIFSYWVLLWYVLFMLNVTIYNPLFLLYIALFLNILGIYDKLSSMRNTLIYIFIIILIKIIPIYSIRHTTIRIQDIYISLLLFFIYLLWIFMNDISIKHIHLELKKNKGPIFVNIHKIIHLSKR
jgi:hypothetical protein